MSVIQTHAKTVALVIIRLMVTLALAAMDMKERTANQKLVVNKKMVSRMRLLVQ